MVIVIGLSGSAAGDPDRLPAVDRAHDRLEVNDQSPSNSLDVASMREVPPLSFPATMALSK
jgi:hypothetical protein